MKNSLRAISIFIGYLWSIFFGLSAVAVLIARDVTMGAVFSVLLAIGIVFIQKQSETQKRINHEAKVKELRENNFEVSKYIKASKEYDVFIDDINKKIALGINKRLKFINFSDIISFELNEDGNTLIEGKGFATAVGGLTFGLLGAMVGSAGKRKSQNTCSSLLVRIVVNDLKSPQIVIPFIKKEIMKNKSRYKSSMEKAKELVAVLKYIENQKSQTISN